MKTILNLLLGIAVTGFVAGCNTGDSVNANADKADQKTTSSIIRKIVVPKTTIPAGTRLGISLIDGVGTTQSSPGDTFMASLSQPVVIDGKTVLDKGTKLRGRVVDVNESGRVKGKASISLVLTDVIRDGNDIGISTRTFSAVAPATKKRDAEVIGGGAGIGALIGGITGGKKGAAVGAAVGGGAGTGTVLATKGKDLHYPPESHLTFTLASPVEI